MNGAETYHRLYQNHSATHPLFQITLSPYSERVEPPYLCHIHDFNDLSEHLLCSNVLWAIIDNIDGTHLVIYSLVLSPTLISLCSIRCVMCGGKYNNTFNGFGTHISCYCREIYAFRFGLWVWRKLPNKITKVSKH